MSNHLTMHDSHVVAFLQRTESGFLKVVNDFLDSENSRRFKSGVTGILRTQKPSFDVLRNQYDIKSTELCGTAHDNDSLYVELASHELFRKAAFHLEGVNPTQNAIDSFLEQMAHAEKQNTVLKTVLDPVFISGNQDREKVRIFGDVMLRAKYYAHILTDYAALVIEHNGVEPRFTDGAIFGTKALKKGNSPIERTSNMAVSASVSKHLGTFMSAYIDTRCSEHVTYDVQAKLSPWPEGFPEKPDPFWFTALSRAREIDLPDQTNFVHKTYKTDRDTFKSFVADLALQCGYGDTLTESLKVNGYDISVLPDTHKVLAKIGSVNGLTATFDMKGGSNNVFTELGKFLLPEPVFESLIASRNHRVQVEDDILNLPIMATAGNGFCFPLETIVFLSLQMGVCASFGLKPKVKKKHGLFGPLRQRRSYLVINDEAFRRVCSTYGDDVIIPSVFASRFIDTFSILGIRLNLDKSFWTGKFRESCGGHFLDGQDVNCFNSKTIPTLENTLETKNFLNGIYTFGYCNNNNNWRHPSLRRLWHGILEISEGIPVNHGPNGDLGVIVPWPVSYTEYVRSALPVFTTPTMRSVLRPQSKPHSLEVRTIEHKRYTQTLRLCELRFPKGGRGLPHVRQSFLRTRYTDKIGLSRHLKENPIHPTLLYQIAGEGLISGSGRIGAICLLHEACDGHCGQSVHAGARVYNDYFINDRLKTERRVVKADPFSLEDESVDALFRRIGLRFENTKLNRLTRESMARRRLRLLESHRSHSHAKLLAVLNAYAQLRNKDILDLF